MIALVVTFQALPDEDASVNLEVALQALARESRGESGCETFQVHRCVESRDVLVLYEKWRDAESLRAHECGPAVARFRGFLSGLTIGAPQVMKLQPLAESAVG